MRMLRGSYKETASVELSVLICLCECMWVCECESNKRRYMYDICLYVLEH